MSSSVLNASAVLVLVNDEAGMEQVNQALSNGAILSTINLSEVVAKLSEVVLPAELIHETLDSLGAELVDFDVDLAYRAGLLRPLTRTHGLSLGDRACLALAQRHNLPVLTSDQSWSRLQIGVTVRIIR